MIKDNFEERYRLNKQPIRSLHGYDVSSPEYPPTNRRGEDVGGIAAPDQTREEHSTTNDQALAHPQEKITSFNWEREQEEAPHSVDFDDRKEEMFGSWGVQATDALMSDPFAGMGGDQLIRGNENHKRRSRDILSDIRTPPYDARSNEDNYEGDNNSDNNSDSDIESTSTMLQSILTARDEARRRASSGEGDGSSLALFREAVTAEDVRAKVESEDQQDAHVIPRSVFGGSITSHGTLASVRSKQRKTTLNILVPPTEQIPAVVVSDPHSSDDDSDDPGGEEVPISKGEYTVTQDGLHIGGRVISWNDRESLRRPFTISETVFPDEELSNSRGSRRFGMAKTSDRSRSRDSTRQCPTCQGTWDSVVYHFDEDGLPHGECAVCVESRLSDLSIQEESRKKRSGAGIKLPEEHDRVPESPPSDAQNLQVDYSGEQQQIMEELEEYGVSIERLNERFRSHTSVCVYRDCYDIASFKIEGKSVNPGLCSSHHRKYDFDRDTGHVKMSLIDVLDRIKPEKRDQHIRAYRCLTQSPTGICFQPKKRQKESCDYCRSSETMSAAGIVERCGYSDACEVKSRKQRSTTRAKSRVSSGKVDGESSVADTKPSCQGKSRGWLASIRWSDNGTTPWCDTHQSASVRDLSTQRTCSSCNKPNWLPRSWKPLSREFYQMTNNTCASCFPRSALAQANPNFGALYEKLKTEANENDSQSDNSYEAMLRMNTARSTLDDQAPWMWVLDSETAMQFADDWETCYNSD